MGIDKSYRRRDHGRSVYFSKEVMSQIEELAHEYPGIKSTSRIIETLAKIVRENKETQAAFEQQLIKDL